MARAPLVATGLRLAPLVLAPVLLPAVLSVLLARRRARLGIAVLVPALLGSLSVVFASRLLSMLLGLAPRPLSLLRGAALAALVPLGGLSALLALFVLSPRLSPLLALSASALHAALPAAVFLVAGLAAVLEVGLLHRVRFEAAVPSAAALLSGPASSSAGLLAALAVCPLTPLTTLVRPLLLAVGLATVGPALFLPAFRALCPSILALATAEEAVEPAAVAVLAVPVAAVVSRAASAVGRSLGTPSISVPVSIGHGVAVDRLSLTLERRARRWSVCDCGRSYTERRDKA
ncbi:hypothetical protein C488_04427 [Natrinema pellirubrum DSM 15624]|uniref:Uncharacterized protein n=1 Tax=Natrinema pellirubrum (strain DSM 15624 / CIP 106293 / JCM 10476 / NCIMB 786 / 157) TaxID=797303 RepID=L9YZ30_NATP1|nr:hypothetical protein C488_04427 [Natrinema pellirubrum DSM 15624]